MAPYYGVVKTSAHTYFGTSLSVKVCRDFGIDPLHVMRFAVFDIGIKHFRLMSYWDEIEREPGVYDFDQLDRLFALAKELGCSVSLAIGKRQPRWPECHIPDWALELPRNEWRDRLYAFIQTVIKRYRKHPALSSYQLENEALLKAFGECPDGDYSRARLRAELQLVKRLDNMHPVVMSLSNNWGLPLLGPFPDMFAMSLYRVIYSRGRYRRSPFPLWWYRVRARLIRLYTRRPVFIHELQAEPWGPDANHKLTIDEQARSMSGRQLTRNITFASKTDLYPIYLWGLEWWYARYKDGSGDRLVQAVKHGVETVN